MKSAKTQAIVLVITVLIMLALTACSRGSSPVSGSNNNTTSTSENIQKALTPISSENAQDYDYIDIGTMFTDAGFANVSTAESFDIDPDSDDSIFTNVVSIGGTSVFEKAEAFPADSAIAVICHRPYEKYILSVHVDFVPNLVFSKYDVDLSINGVKQEILEHGKDADFEFRLKEGDYSIVFAKSDSLSINGSTEIKVENNTIVSYKIACYNDEVTVEDLTSQYLEQQQAQAAEDERKAAEAAAAEKAAEMARTLERQLPQEMAKRAAIVAITNYCAATDVFMPDRNNLDISKFHSYADTSGNFFGYYLCVESWGEWSAKAEDIWHAEKLTYVNCYGNEFNAAFDVQYDGENYIVTNVATSFGSLNDPSRSGVEKYSEDFVVTPDLVKDDRGQPRLDSYNSWVNDQFSSWDGSHRELTTLIKKNLNDENSYKHIETTYRIIDSEYVKTEINDVLKSANKSTRVEIGDLFISTEFSAKNAFNATIKKTAYSVASFAENTINLISFE